MSNLQEVPLYSWWLCFWLSSVWAIDGLNSTEESLYVMVTSKFGGVLHFPYPHLFLKSQPFCWTLAFRFLQRSLLLRHGKIPNPEFVHLWLITSWISLNVSSKSILVILIVKPRDLNSINGILCFWFHPSYCQLFEEELECSQPPSHSWPLVWTHLFYIIKTASLLLYVSHLHLYDDDDKQLLMQFLPPAWPI